MGLSERLFGTAAATVDRAVVIAARFRGARRSRAEALPHAERIERLGQIRDIYSTGELVSDPDRFFVRPSPIEPRVRVVRKLAHGGEVLDVSWKSDVDTFSPHVRASYKKHARNLTAHARLWVGKKPRPVAILVHGYMAGQWALEERAWPIASMLRRGLDVAIVLLPFHALRSRSDGGATPPFPGADPRFTNEGFRQAVMDIRGLAQWLRARGAPAVGMMGMSLGGYTTALMATLERDLAFAVPIIPLASLADFARDQGRLGSEEESRLQHAALEEANWVVSPFARPPALPSERIVVVGAESDRITPVSHAHRLARHFGAPLVTFHGGHLLQFGRRDALREVWAMLRRAGIATGPEGARDASR